MNRNPYEPHVGQQVIVGHCSTDKELLAEIIRIIGREDDGKWQDGIYRVNLWRVVVKANGHEDEADWYLSEQVTDHLTLRYGKHYCWPADMAKPNLKRVFMELGNKLVTEHGFDPGVLPDNDLVAANLANEDTKIITLFTEFVNRHEEAQQVLKELGLLWPVVKGRRHGS